MTKTTCTSKINSLNQWTNVYLRTSHQDYLASDPSQLVPPSCCGKHKDNKKDKDQCSVDELKNVRGCGGLLIDWFSKEYQKERDDYYPKSSFAFKMRYFFSESANPLWYTLKASITLLAATLVYSITKQRNVLSDSQNRLDLSINSQIY